MLNAAHLEKFDGTLATEWFYLSGFLDKKANDNQRFEARLLRNDLGERVDLAVF